MARRELRLFLRMSEQAGIEVEEQAQSLGLSGEDWQDWLGVLADAPLPRHPELPMMLRRIGYICHRLERRAALRGSREAASGRSAPPLAVVANRALASGGGR